VCLVIDNSECLEGKSLDALHKLIEGTACGVGILLGGEPDLHQYLHDAGIAASLHLDVTSAEPRDEEEQQETGASLLAVLPWKHLAAVLGLVILIWLFWPADDNTDAAVQPLALPVPEKPAAVQQEEREPSPAPDSRDPVAAAALESIHTPVAEPEPRTEKFIKTGGLYFALARAQHCQGN